MALRVIWEMCGHQNGYRGVGKALQSSTGKRAFGMEYESDWTKNRVSSAFTAQVIRSATSLMPWSCKIPIGDGFHEFL
ncbi:hypothetical protein Gotri_022936 [Gossypium trilobum]|uniref:Uncharacterized protein n=1 Tax=Gossypium trilobum TaxID=34281 RepID=A0A7J9DHJ4_9ROSI|nr:hypothetical protein [Gossypium trilobum]